jgi:hypothetical protein
MSNRSHDFSPFSWRQRAPPPTVATCFRQSLMKNFSSSRVWRRLRAGFPTNATFRLSYQFHYKFPSRFVSICSGRPVDEEHHRPIYDGQGDNSSLKGALPPLNACLPPHGHRTGPKGLFSKDTLPSPMIRIGLPIEESGLHGSGGWLPVPFAVYNEQVLSGTHLSLRKIILAKLPWYKPDPSTWMESLAVRQAHQLLRAASGVLNWAFSINKHGRDQGIGRQLSARILLRKRILHSRVTSQRQCFSTTSVGWGLRLAVLLLLCLEEVFS